MNMMAIDTHKVIKRLEKVGFSEIQAETVTDILRETSDINMESVVTKADLNEALAPVHQRMDMLDHKMDSLKISTKSEIDSLKSDIDGLRISTKSDIDSLRISTKSDLIEAITPIKAEITILKWMLGFVLAGIVSIVLKLFL